MFEFQKGDTMVLGILAGVLDLAAVFLSLGTTVSKSTSTVGWEERELQ